MFNLIPLIAAMVLFTIIILSILHGYDTSGVATGSIIIMHTGPYIGSNNW